MVQVVQAPCHDTCLDVVGINGHTANVNPIGETNPVKWRVDCDDCGTCIRAGFETKAQARDAAMVHVQSTSEEYWKKRDAGDF